MAQGRAKPKASVRTPPQGRRKAHAAGVAGTSGAVGAGGAAGVAGKASRSGGGAAPSATSAGARARKRAERREAILTAALDEFAARGFAAARLEDVARRAGVAKGTI